MKYKNKTKSNRIDSGGMISKAIERVSHNDNKLSKKKNIKNIDRTIMLKKNSLRKEKKKKRDLFVLDDLIRLARDWLGLRLCVCEW